MVFKENVTDIRNSKVVDVVRELEDFGVEVLVHDPLADVEETWHEYGLGLTRLDVLPPVDAVVLAVAHEQFRSIDAARLAQLCGNGDGCGVVVDVKGMLDRNEVEQAGLRYWSL